MSAEKFSSFGFEYLEKTKGLVEDKFVGRESELKAFAEILEYPLRGKEMPVLLVKGTSGTGKSWLLSKFASRLDAERLPYVAYNLRSPISGNLPGAWFGLSEEISNKYKLETPRFDRIADIFDRRFRGIEREEAVESKGFFRGFIDQFTGGGQPEELTSPKMYREYGKDWEDALTSRPMHEHLRAMALALAEDIDYGLDRKKYPFLTIILDSWNIATARQAPLWKALAQNSSRLFMIIALQAEADFPDARAITLYDFNERETREALARRGIASQKAVADILGNTAGSPLTVSLAVSLAELVSRKGDIIRADTFDVLSNEDPAETYCRRCWELLRDSEQFALCSAVKSPGLPSELLAELHAQRADMPAGLLSAIEFVPFDPPMSPSSPVKIHEEIFDIIENLSHGVAFTNIADLSRRTERLLENENLLDWEVLLGRLDIRLEPENALSLIFERIMALKASGEISAAESLWRCSHPEGNVPLAVIHRLIGFELLNEYLSPVELKE
ncbi:MAG TPA: ATP-binding protein, partial [candidate division Zixibacteria bacterium]|nr:ATP-binding protein [candidate division Zixibacteria bacterium]